MKGEHVHELFRQTARRLRGNVAITGGGRSLSYGELEERSNRIAWSLIGGGAAPGSIVAILTRDSFHVIEAILGVLKAGCAFLPLDPAVPEPRLAAMVAEAAPQWYLSEPELAPVVERLAAAGGRRVRLVLLSPGTAPTCLADCEIVEPPVGPMPPEPGVERGRDDLCYVYFTSGSTGTPKGIMGRLKAIDHFIRWEIETLGLEEGVRVSQLTSPSFDAFLRDAFVPLCAGGVVCVPAWRAPLLSGAELAGWLERERIQVLHCVPSVFRLLLEERPEAGRFPALRYVLLAGEPLLPVDVGRAADLFGERVRLVNLYGPSETTMTKLCYFVRPEDRHRKSIPIGKPIRGARALVLGPAGVPCPPGEVGEIYIRTPYRALGYLNRPELTREAFVPNPLSGDPDDIVYKTGDFGRLLEDGDLEFLGRRDHQVKIRGVRVELADIENVLRSHPQVADVVAVARERGPGETLLCAYVALRGEVRPGELRNLCARSLIEPMVPDAFVVLPSLPRTITGKVDRAALPEPGDPGSPTASGDDTRDLVEELLAGMWTELLGRSRIQGEDDFFELGGHSLLATRLLARIRAAFGVELDPRELFARPTLAGVAGRVRALLAADLPPAPPLERRRAGGPAPLSFGQQRLWLLQQLNPGSSAYNMAQAIHIDGVLDIAALRAALGEVVRRHEVLRTTFPSGGEPVQVVAPAPEPALTVVDLSGLDAMARERRAREIGRQEMGRPFDLAHGPVIRASLLWLAAQEHVLLLTVHHIASDAWSMEILRRDLLAFYAAITSRRPSPLRELPVQYADFALWQRSWLQGEVLAVQSGYWRRQLAGAPPLLELPLDRPRPPLQTFRGTRQALDLGTPLMESLRALSRRRGATLFMTLMASLQALLGGAAGTRDVSVGVPVAGRERFETEELIGFFVNTLVIRTDLSGAPDFLTLLDRVRGTMLDAHAHQVLPFEKLVEELQPQRSLQHSPLFQVMFVLQNAPREAHELPGLRLRPLRLEGTVAKLDMTLAMVESDEGLHAELEVSSDLFDAATALRVLRQLSTLLTAIADDPGRRPADLPVLGPAERAQLLVEWNDTAVPAEDVECVHQIFERRVRESPAAVAAAGQSRDLSYGELNRRANQLARHLVRLGVGPETLVGVCLERSPEMLVALLGILKTGGGYLPLDPSYPRERLHFMLVDSNAPVVLSKDGLKGLLPMDVPVVSLDGDAGLLATESGEDLALPGRPDGLAYVIYTSGSTGRPKGVEVCHRAVVNLLRSIRDLLRPDRDTRLLALTSLSFDIAGLELFLPLLIGARVEIAERELAADGRRLAQRIQASGATVVQATPATWSLLVESGWPGEPGLQALCGGEALAPALAVALAARCRTVWNVYGPTEATIWSTFWRVDPGLGRVLIGGPLANTQIHLLDGDLLPVPLGVPGHLHIGGIGVARGYRARPDLTAERFIPDPFASRPGERLYQTGDLARRLPDGRLDFLGRFDHQVKIRGFRIELGEIEATLGRHPQVRETVVTARRDPRGEWYIAAYVVARGAEAPTTSELRRFLARDLPDSMVPSAFMLMERLPLTPNGKVDRKALPDPDGSRPRLETAYIAPQSEQERALAAVWQEALGVERVGVHDNFFDLGGHSLLLVRVYEKLRTSHPELQLIELFIHPTIGSLARHLAAPRPGSAVREAAQVQRRLEGHDRLKRRLEIGKQAGIGGRKAV